MRRTKRRFAKKSLSLEELAKQQGVKPIHDLDEVISLWPKDDDPDELLRFILNERRARRKLVEEASAEVNNGNRP
ncbi:MAG TPA: hypothetical protein VKS79_24465 [Gemmataceae bacterium]|nr:hypothetical protein [Gemmataceae bacterium]